ncbi:protein kinase domain-containing protein [Aquabacterium sp.]|uniref:protein kinase domain-containing protein n=1 Tax=Aquabacterium sp. TaxID=1872578 RepID=UPI002BBB0C20|nr:HDOD domain-containing protein [Aquabacterium sp.]HSW07679.1 HDOD domain-containing protein [Aquabacterium sp.]
MAVRPGRRVGRFKLAEELGRGAQATVWRAHDERLDRDVALKLLNPEADTVAVSQWLHEARAVSRLSHPHIVPVFEADEHNGQPYLVFELVRGHTLADVLKRKGAMAARDAGVMLLGVLDALRVAHEHGIVHRDLKPSNILIDADGRARVMDFGIAARAADTSDGRIIGTPGYMSPEAARGLPPTPLMDVFAAGMVLAEMLCGKPLLREKDPYRALHRVVNEDMALPDGVQIDDALRAVVQRALARDATMRFDSASAMRDALQAWLQPQQGEGAAGGASNGTLEFLLRRMRHKSDFPTLSDSVVRIQRIATSENESLNSLAGEILKDVALTNKLLRMVNTVHYSSAGGGSISTVSRAVALVGFAGIRNMALSLVLLEHMKDKGHAIRLREEFLRSLMAGQLASELSPVARDTEEAFLGAMFHNLGRLLTEYYFPEEAQSIREQLQPKAQRGDAALPSAESVSERVLGIGFEQLGLGVARSWGLPEGLQRCMRRPDTEPPNRAVERGAERLRWLSAAANEAADAILRSEPEQLDGKLSAVAERFGKALALGSKDLLAAAAAARQKLAQLAPAMGLQLPSGSAALRLLTATAKVAPQDAGDSLSPYELQATIPMPAPAPIAEAAHAPTLVLVPPERVAELLAAGIQDITNTMASEQFRLNEVLRMILETMYRSMGFQRVVFCLRDAKSGMLQGRFGLGAQADVAAKAFSVDLRKGATPDLFSAVCLKGADTLISDARATHIAQRLPSWYAKQVNAASFLLLPMSMKNAPFALIYGDKAAPGELALGERELALLRTLRNQAVMAFRQVG